MAGPRDEAERFLADRPDGEAALREVLEVDAATEDWTFDDLDLDSGTFGEVVSRGLVESTEDGYRVPDRTAVEAALSGDSGGEPAADADGEPAVDTAADSPTGTGPSAKRSLPNPADAVRIDVTRTELAVLAALVGLVVVVRLVPVGSVFRNGDVVLLGNDPYSYRYWTEHLLAEYGTFDPFALGDLPERVRTDDVTLFVALWAAASLLPVSAGTVLALYPVVAAAVTAVVVYALGRALTPDRRVAAAAVALLAVVPVHAYRTTLGFADHHAFDYLWIAVTLVALVALRADALRSPERSVGDLVRSRRQVGYALVLGGAVTIQTFAWRGAPILTAPLVVYGVVIAVADVRADRRDGGREVRSPLADNGGFLLGLGLAAALSWLLYLGLGWGTDHRTLLPAAFFVVVLGVFAAAEASVRAAVRPRTATAGTVAAAGAVALLVWSTTSVFTRLYTRADSWVLGALGRDTAGTVSLVGPELGTVVGPILRFSFVFFFALAVAVAVTLREGRGEHTPWVAPAVYFWYLLGWTGLFIRFGGSLAIAAAPLAGYGFLALTGKYGYTREPVGWRATGERSAADRPAVGSRGTAVGAGGAGGASGDDAPDLRFPSLGTVRNVALVFLVVASFSFVQIPIKQSQLAIDGETYRTATWIDGDAADRRLDYPANFVLTRWPKSRVFNYFVSGQSATYGFAEEHYEPFVTGNDTGEWYERLDDGVGYVVVSRSYADFATASNYRTLFDRYGSDRSGDPASGAEHYRALHASESGRHAVFDLVPGAVLTGEAPPNRTISVETPLDLGGETVTYRRTVETTVTGRYAVRVPNPGTYAAPDGEKAVPEPAVENGTFVARGDGVARLPLDAGRGSVAFDSTGGNHGFVEGAAWTRVDGGRALAFDGESFVRVPDAPAPAEATAGDGDGESAGLTVSARFRTNESVDYRADGRYYPIVARAPESGVNLRNEGYLLAVREGRIVASVGDGAGTTRVIVGPRVDGGEWHRATLRWDGSRVGLTLDGDLVERKGFELSRRPPDHPLFVGGPPGYRNFRGVIDDVWVGNRSVAPPEIGE